MNLIVLLLICLSLTIIIGGAAVLILEVRTRKKAMKALTHLETSVGAFLKETTGEWKYDSEVGQLAFLTNVLKNSNNSEVLNLRMGKLRKEIEDALASIDIRDVQEEQFEIIRLVALLIQAPEQAAKDDI